MAALAMSGSGSSMILCRWAVEALILAATEPRKRFRLLPTLSVVECGLSTTQRGAAAGQPRQPMTSFKDGYSVTIMNDARRMAHGRRRTAQVKTPSQRDADTLTTVGHVMPARLLLAWCHQGTCSRGGACHVDQVAWLCLTQHRRFDTRGCLVVL